jgi:hypothetical protein
MIAPADKKSFQAMAVEAIQALKKGSSSKGLHKASIKNYIISNYSGLPKGKIYVFLDLVKNSNSI